MAFIKYAPYGSKKPYDISTTSRKEIQLWQELTMLRHVSGQNAIYARETIAPWIDQAKIYFLDACSSNWKSAGLLYYYSFLNLAKAHLVTNRAVSGRNLKSTSIYHGLNAGPANPNRIINFQIEIHPPSARGGKRNIFSQFYQKLIKEPWPFTTPITIDISNVIPYCDDISHEINIFYNIPKANINILSLIRDDGANVWVELFVPDYQIPNLQRDLGHIFGLVKNHAALTQLDKSEWQAAYGLMPTNLRDHSLVRINQLAYTAANKPQVYMTLQQNVEHHLNGYIVSLPIFDYNANPYWHFIPKITINNTLIKWHPLLSDYLIAFMLSTVLRYQPHLFITNSKDSFLGEAWCNQSSITAIRYFLSEISKQNIRVD